MTTTTKENTVEHPSAEPVSRGYLLANRIGGGLIALTGLYVVQQAVVYGILREGQPADGFYPIIVGGLLSVLGCALLLTARSESKVRGEDSHLPDRSGAIKLAVTGAAIAGFLLLLEPLGYVGTMVLFLIAILKAASNLRVITILLIAVGFTLATFYGFSKALGVPLPLSHLIPLAALGF
jgi:putative tricarboxylic transport membrane protein